MKNVIAVLALGAVLVAAAPAAARDADLEGIDEQLSRPKVSWPLEPRVDVRYPGHILILDLGEV